MPVRKILVVDDDETLRESLVEQLSLYEEFETSQEGTATAGVQRARSEPTDLVIMDIRMPGLNGVETYLEIKKISPNSRVVMMTGFSVEELVTQALEEGVFAVLYKPLPVEQVLDILKSGEPTDDTKKMQDPIIGQP